MPINVNYNNVVFVESSNSCGDGRIYGWKNKKRVDWLVWLS
jgi:hypothetical protein